MHPNIAQGKANIMYLFRQTLQEAKKTFAVKYLSCTFTSDLKSITRLLYIGHI